MDNLQQVQEIQEEKLRIKDETIEGVRSAIRGARMKAKMYADKQLECLREDLRLITNGEIDITASKETLPKPHIIKIKVQENKD